MCFIIKQPSNRQRRNRLRIPLSSPDITQKEIDAVIEVMKTGILSIGPKIKEFERKIADYNGVAHAIAVNSGTSGLHIVIKAYGIKKGDEVITTPFSFIASANCIIYEGATPVFCDIDPHLLEMDLWQLEKKITPKTKAILAVDVFGHPCNISELRRISQKYGLLLIEDACEALGSEHMGIKTGSGADAAVFAFYPNKQITTAEGGCIITNNDKIAKITRELRNQGRTEEDIWMQHKILGYNYRLNELGAAIGSVQMDRIDEILDKRALVARSYNQKLKNIKGINLPNISPNTTRMSWFIYAIRLDETLDRDLMMRHLISKGIGCRPYFTPIHTQEYIAAGYGYKEDDFPNTIKASKSHIALPFHNNISGAEIDYIAEVIKEWTQKCI